MPTGNVITWTEITAECGDFRAGFIAVFRKYEGKSTDEKDAQGRIVKVTAASFARHMGIAERTFKNWLKLDGRSGRLDPDRDVGQESARRAIRDPEKRAKVIDSLTPEERVEVVKAAAKDLSDADTLAVSRAITHPGRRVPDREPDITELLAKAQNKFSDGNFTIWRIMEELEDLPPATGEDQVRRLARIDGCATIAAIGPRIVEALRRYVETGTLDAEIAAELKRGVEEGRAT